MTKIYKGSEWRKWDLHVHTPFSIYQRFGNNDAETWEKYIKDLEDLSKDFAVIGVNDYLFLDGYEKLKAEQTNNSRLANLKLLPVVEFRIDKFAGINFEQLKRINLHVIFSDDVTIETIQSQFLNTLEQSYFLGSGEPWTRAITRQSVEELGKEIKSKIPATELHKYDSDLTEGFNNLNVKEDNIFESLNKDCFKGKYLIAIGKTEWGELKWSDSSIATKKSIINRADIVFTASKSVEDFGKAKIQLTNQGVNDLLLDCSDAHYLSTETDKDRIGNCFTWIKADPIFEGLRQILYEPNHRLKIQQEKPDYKEEKLVIEMVKFTSPNSTFTPEPIYLNDNLNVIIGGKSSGKSILLFNIAKTLLTDRSDMGPLKFKDTEDSKYKYLYELNDFDPDFDFEVVLKSGSKQSIHRADDVPSVLSDIKYIPQNYLSNLVDRSRKQGYTLKTLIRNLILEDDSYKTIYSDFVSKVQGNDAKRNNLIEEYFQLKVNITAQEQELMQKGDKDAIAASIISSQQQIQKLNEESGLRAEQIAEYTLYNDELNQINITYGKLVSDYKKLIAFHQELSDTLSNIETKKQELLESLEIEAVKQEFGAKYSFIKNAIASAEEAYKLLETNEANTLVSESSIRRMSQDGAKRKLELEILLKPFQEKQKSKAQIPILEKSIQEDSQKLSVIQKLTTEIGVNTTNLNRKKASIFELYAANFKEYEHVINAFEPRVKSIEGEDEKLEIQGVIKYNFPKFRKSLEQVTDLRRFNEKSLNISTDTNTALSGFSFGGIESDIKDLFEKIENGTHPLKKATAMEAIKKIFTDHFFDHWEVTSEGDTIHNMSTGKASFVLLKLIIKLSKAKAPILIDQPEDNLDNRSVSNDLVTYLRDKKIDRQIIIVTHNPNIVVNADAENIIVANQNGQNGTDSSSPYKFDYINGSLENSFPKNAAEEDILKSMGIREHIAEIVEGGKDAFKKREEKYGF